MRQGFAMLAVAAAVAVPALPAIARPAAAPWDGGAAVASPLELRLGQVASVLAGRPVTATCHSPVDWRALAAAHGIAPSRLWSFVEGTNDGAGFVPGNGLDLAARTCRELADYTAARPSDRGRYCRVAGRLDVCPGYVYRVLALETVAHEAQHLRGIGAESVAECRGAQYLRVVARALGASREQARAMTVDYFTLIYPQNPPSYRSPACRRGGTLDLHLASSFP